MSHVDLPVEQRKLMRTLVTPEGVDLNLEVGTAGARFGALVIDLLIQFGVLLVIFIGGLLAAGAMRNQASEWVGVFWLLGMFLLRNGYFLFFEMSARAATPGKRLMGLRVAARDGGRLRFESVFTRNVLRELEVFLPISIVLGGPARETGAVGAWMYLLVVIWCLTFCLIPLFNADKLRAGDMIAGTWVLRTPRHKLLRDMADEGPAYWSAINFTPAQLDAYGVKELQVLEQVLRVRDSKTIKAVAERIAAKIDYDRSQVADLDFLRAYYQALRGRQESRLLMGKRRRDKFDRDG